MLLEGTQGGTRIPFEMVIFLNFICVPFKGKQATWVHLFYVFEMHFSVHPFYSLNYIQYIYSIILKNGE